MENKQDRLIEKCRMGNNQAKACLYKQYVPVLLGVCRRYINDRMEAEDLVHESFITIFEKIGHLKQNQALEAWMRKIVVNNALKALKAKIHFSDLENLKEPENDEDDEANSELTRHKVQQLELSQDEILSLIDSLPPGFRAVFNLYVFEKLNHNEIAEALGISAGTSRSQLVRARKMIQKKLIEKVEKEEKAGKKEKVYSATLLLFMSDDLLYIDQLVWSKLNGLKLEPVSYPGFLSKRNGINGKTFSSSGKSRFLFLSGKNLIWISAIILSGVGTALIFFAGKNENKNSEGPVFREERVDTLPPEKNKDTLLLPEPAIDSRTTPLPSDAEASGNVPLVRDTTIKKEVVLKKKVIMRKTIAVKKEKIVSDTIRKTNTFPKDQDSTLSR